MPACHRVRVAVRSRSRRVRNYSWPERSLAAGAPADPRVLQRAARRPAAARQVYFPPTLLRELIEVALLQTLDSFEKALGIDEPIGVVGVARLVLFVHPELPGVRRQPDVDLHLF